MTLQYQDHHSQVPTPFYVVINHFCDCCSSCSWKYHSTRNGDGLSTSYPSNGSVSFDGVDDHLNITGQSDLAFGTGDFTLEFWVYLLFRLYSRQCIMETRSTTSGSDGFLIGRFHTSGYENKIVLYTDGGYRIFFSLWFRLQWSGSTTNCILW